MQPVESMDVAGEQVVLDDAPVLGPVAADDRVVLVVQQLGPTFGFSPRHVSGAFGLDHVARDAQPDTAVGLASAVGDDLVGVLGGDLVAKEPRRAGAGVGDQRLGLGQLQLEILLQELSEATFDLLGFVLRSSEPEQDVICVPNLTQSPIARITWIPGRNTALLLAQRSCSGMITAFASTMKRASDPAGLRIGTPEHSSVVSRHQNRLDEAVQPVQVDVG